MPTFSCSFQRKHFALLRDSAAHQPPSRLSCNIGVDMTPTWLDLNRAEPRRAFPAHFVDVEGMSVQTNVGQNVVTDGS